MSNYLKNYRKQKKRIKRSNKS